MAVLRKTERHPRINRRTLKDGGSCGFSGGMDVWYIVVFILYQKRKKYIVAKTDFQEKVNRENEGTMH